DPSAWRYQPISSNIRVQTLVFPSPIPRERWRMHRSLTVSALAAFAAVAMLAVPAQSSPYLYVTSGSGVYTLQRANLDGTGVQTLSTTAGAAFAIDEVNEKIYYGQETPSVDIKRANLDGSGATTYLAGWRPLGIDIDAANGRAFFTSSSVVNSASLTSP